MSGYLLKLKPRGAVHIVRRGYYIETLCGLPIWSEVGLPWAEITGRVGPGIPEEAGCKNCLRIAKSAQMRGIWESI